MRNKIFFTILFLAAFLERTIFDLGSNYELVTTAMILAVLYLGNIQAFVLVFLIMFLSDLVIGNTNIFIFTWSGFLIPAILAHKLINKKGIVKKLASGTMAGAASVGFFFVWTNFGVWLTTTMYSKDVFGLIHSYINAIPFLRNQAVSALIFIPLGMILTEIAFSLLKNLQKQKITNRSFT